MIEVTHPGPFSRALVVLLLTLALATGLVAGSLIRLGQQSLTLSSAPEPSAVLVGRAFYDAVNLLLESGSETDLRNVVAGDFRRMKIASADPGDADSLITELAAQSSLQDGLRMTIESITSSANLVFATIRLSAPEPAAFAGLPVETADPGAYQEILRVQDDLVVEQWVDHFPQPLLSTIATVERVSFPDVPVLKKWSFDPRAYLQLSSARSRIIIGESGAVSVEFDARVDGAIRYFRSDFAKSRSVETEEASGQVVIRGGDALIVSGEVELRLSNLEERSATFLELTSEASSEEHAVLAQGFGPVARDWIVARGAAIGGDDDLRTLSVGLAVLGDGETFAQQGLEAVNAFLIPVDQDVSVIAPPTQVWTIDARQQMAKQDEALIASGTGAAIVDAQEVTYSSIEGHIATFLVVTVAPSSTESS